MECGIDGAIGLEFCIDRYYMFSFLFAFYDFPWGTKSLASFLFLLPVRLFGFPITAVSSS
jgi:hypothetical protein